MRHSLWRAVLVAVAVLVKALVQAEEFAGPETLRPGQRGIGKTVFQGTTIDTFGAEILGVVRNGLGPKQDLILARLSGGPLAESGVVRGMSGSPVYVEGRLIGAVAYAWSFARTPLCGITPIGEMLRVAARGLDLPPEGGRLQGGLRLGPEATDLMRAALGDPSLPGPVALEALGTPVWVSGSTPAATRVLQDLLDPLGLRTVAGPAGEALLLEQPTLVPGASLGVQLIGGDMTATGIGTLTYVDGERVLGFGHPMMLAGATDMPMTGAYIYGIMPSQAMSFKLGSATRPVGAVRQDRAAAIAGILGPLPDLVPVEVQVRSGAGEQSFHFQILRHPDLTSGLAQTVLLAALESAEKLAGPATLRLRSRVQLNAGQTLDKEQVYSGPASIWQAAEQAVAPLAALDHSPFAGLWLETLAFAVELSERIETAQVLGLRVDRSVLRPGDSFVARVSLQPYRRESVEQKVELEMPANATPGPVVLRVGSSAAGQAWESERRPDADTPRTAAQLLEQLRYPEPGDELFVELYRPEEAFTIDGRELPGLPPSAQAILREERSAGHLGPVRGRVLQRERVRTPFVLAGEQTLELTVREPR